MFPLVLQEIVFLLVITKSFSMRNFPFFPHDANTKFNTNRSWNFHFPAYVPVTIPYITQEHYHGSMDSNHIHLSCYQIIWPIQLSTNWTKAQLMMMKLNKYPTCWTSSNDTDTENTMYNPACNAALQNLGRNREELYDLQLKPVLFSSIIFFYNVNTYNLFFLLEIFVHIPLQVTFSWTYCNRKTLTSFGCFAKIC